jgi:hypothetical protein
MARRLLAEVKVRKRESGRVSLWEAATTSKSRIRTMNQLASGARTAESARSEVLVHADSAVRAPSGGSRKTEGLAGAGWKQLARGSPQFGQREEGQKYSGQKLKSVSSHFSALNLSVGVAVCLAIHEDAWKRWKGFLKKI